MNSLLFKPQKNIYISDHYSQSNRDPEDAKSAQITKQLFYRLQINSRYFTVKYKLL